MAADGRGDPLGLAVGELGVVAPVSCQLTGVERLGDGPGKRSVMKAGVDAVREGKTRSARHRRPLSAEEVQLTEFHSVMNSVHANCLMKCYGVLNILVDQGICCGGVWLLKNEFARRPIFLVEFGNGLEQKVDFWTKFELNRN